MRIHHVAITVDNLEQSIRFYCDCFGWKLLYKKYRPEKGRSWAMLQMENSCIELREFSDMKENNDVLNDITIRWIRHIAFQVDNIIEEVKKLEAKWLSFTAIQESSIGWYYTFTSDPNGVAIELYEIPK